MRHAALRAIRELIDRVRARWRALRALRGDRPRRARRRRRSLGVALVAARWTTGAPVRCWCSRSRPRCCWPRRRSAGRSRRCAASPADGQVARFIEERAPSLDDRLVSAVDVADRRRDVGAPALAEPMLADAAPAGSDVDLDTVVPASALRRAGFQAAAAVLVLAAPLFVGARARRGRPLDAASLTLFPVARRARGHARQRAHQGRLAAGDSRRGSSATARRSSRRCRSPTAIAGARRRWPTDAAGRVPARRSTPVTAPFKYRVVAGAVTSPTYDVTVAHPPRVTRIDVDYTYPAGPAARSRAPRRTAATSTRRPAPTCACTCSPIGRRPPAQMALGDGKPLALTADDADRVLGVAEGGRRQLVPRRARRPRRPRQRRRHRVLHPHARGSPARRPHPEAGDRSLGDAARGSGHRGAGRGRLRRRSARARVRGARRRREGRAARRSRARARRSPAATRCFSRISTSQPGDFVSYYVRARDLTRGTRPNEARSDIFFLEVKPFEQEFALAQSQGGMAGGGAQRHRRSRRRAEGDHRRDLEARSARAGGERREVRAGHPVGLARRGGAEDARRSRRRARSASRRCAIRGGGSRSGGRGGPPQPPR